MKLILILGLTVMMAGCRADVSPNSNDSSAGVQREIKSDNNGKIYEEEKPDATGVIVELPKLAEITPDKLSETFDEPYHVRQVGTARSYSINRGEAELTIIFKENAIDSLRLKLEKPRDSAADALRAAGFEIKDQPDWENKIVRLYENRVFNKIKFERIEATMSPSSEKWDSVIAELYLKPFKIDSR